MIFDNQFKWKYVGICSWLLLRDILVGLMVLLFVLYGMPYLFSIIFKEDFSTNPLEKDVLIWSAIAFYGLYLLEYAFVTLPQMITGIYRVNGDYLQVKEKIFGLNLVEMCVPLSALSAVSIKKERRWKRRKYPYKVIEIKTNDVTFDLHCLAHQEELYKHLQKAVENNKNNN